MNLNLSLEIKMCDQIKYANLAESVFSRLQKEFKAFPTNCLLIKTSYISLIIYMAFMIDRNLMI
jgi:hypothetical protein